LCPAKMSKIPLWRDGQKYEFDLGKLERLIRDTLKFHSAMLNPLLELSQDHRSNLQVRLDHYRQKGLDQFTRIPTGVFELKKFKRGRLKWRNSTVETYGLLDTQGNYYLGSREISLGGSLVKEVAPRLIAEQVLDFVTHYYVTYTGQMHIISLYCPESEILVDIPDSFEGELIACGNEVMVLNANKSVYHVGFGLYPIIGDGFEYVGGTENYSVLRLRHNDVTKVGITKDHLVVLTDNRELFLHQLTNSKSLNPEIHFQKTKIVDIKCLRNQFLFLKSNGEVGISFEDENGHISLLNLPWGSGFRFSPVRITSKKAL